MLFKMRLFKSKIIIKLLTVKITKHVCCFIFEILQPTTANLLKSNGWIFTNKEKQEMSQDFHPFSIKRFNSYIGTFNETKVKILF